MDNILILENQVAIMTRLLLSITDGLVRDTFIEQIKKTDQRIKSLTLKL